MGLRRVVSCLGGLCGTILAAGCHSTSEVSGGTPSRAMDGGAVFPVIQTPRDTSSPPPDSGPPPDIGPPRRIEGRFVEVPLTPPGPSRYAVITDFVFGEPETTAGLFVDLDGDGRDELLDVPQFLSVGREERRASVFRQDPGVGWRFDEAATTRMQWRVFAAADLDGDGFNDLVVDANGPAIAWGGMQGPGEPALLEPPSQGTTNERRLISVFLDDLDHDGWLDLFLGRDQCRSAAGPLEVWLAQGTRRFARREILPAGPRVKPYAVGVAHPRAEETVYATLGGPCSIEDRPRTFLREEGVDPEGFPRLAWFNPIPDDPDFDPQRRDPNLALYVPMASSWSDLDNDGRFDLLVTLDPVHGLFQGRDAWPLAERTNHSGFSRLSGSEGRPLLPWGALAIDLDHDGRAEVLYAHGNDLGGWQGPRFSPTQWVTAHQNRGGLRFEELDGGVGAAIPGQWRALVAGDPDGDGDADLALGGSGEHPRYLRNDIGPASQSLSLRLVGTSSNALAMGAVVEVDAHEDVVSQHLLIGSVTEPNVMPSPWAFASVGPSGRAPTVRIRWPSGLRQVLRDVQGGRAHRVVEPSLFAITPPSRHQPVGASFALRITPRAEDGALSMGASVEATLLRGAERVPLALSRDPEGWTATVPPSLSAGSARIALRVDGVPLRVLPRVWWDAP